jgi:hypothetical protein
MWTLLIPCEMQNIVHMYSWATNFIIATTICNRHTLSPNMYYSIIYNITLAFHQHCVFMFHMILRINRNYLLKIINPLIFGRILRVFSELGTGFLLNTFRRIPAFKSLHGSEIISESTTSKSFEAHVLVTSYKISKLLRAGRTSLHNSM